MTDTRFAGDTAVYLYGVARNLDPAALGDAAGVAGAPVRGIVAGGLTALVSTVRLEEYGEAALRANLEDLAWLESTARAHHDVVDRAAHSAPTAPVRIATLYRDDARVAEVLADQGERFVALLDRITGRSEWGVKAYASPETLRGDPPPAQGAGDPLIPVGGSRPGPSPSPAPAPPAPRRPVLPVRAHRRERGRPTCGAGRTTGAAAPTPDAAWARRPTACTPSSPTTPRPPATTRLRTPACRAAATARSSTPPTCWTRTRSKTSGWR